MKEENNIESLFKDSFKDFEVDAGPQVWSNIQSGINSASAAYGSAAASSAASSSASWMSTLIVGLGITGLTVGGYFFFADQAGKTQENASQSAPTTEKLQKETVPSNQVIETASTDEQNELSDPVDQTLSAEKDVNRLRVNSIQRKERGSAADLEKENSTVETEESTQNEASVSQLNEFPDIKNPSVVPDQEASTTVSTDEDFQQNTSQSRSESSEQTQVEEPELPESYSVNDFTEEKPVAKEIQLVRELPNVFSPNGDGTNDDLIINTSFFNHADEIHFTLYDGNNNIIFEDRGTEVHFNGMINGSVMEEGSKCYYVVYIKYADQTKIFKPQVLTIK